VAVPGTADGFHYRFSCIDRGGARHRLRFSASFVPVLCIGFAVAG